MPADELKIKFITEERAPTNTEAQKEAVKRMEIERALWNTHFAFQEAGTMARNIHELIRKAGMIRNPEDNAKLVLKLVVKMLDEDFFRLAEHAIKNYLKYKQYTATNGSK